MDLPESKGPESKNKVVKGITTTTFVKGEMLFTKDQKHQENEKYVLGQGVDLENPEEMIKASRNKWDINNMFRNHFAKGNTDMIR
jgi:hypothetical protein